MNMTAGPNAVVLEAMRTIWEDAIGERGIDETRSFLDVGGNSVALFLIVEKIREAWGVDVEPELFFQEDGSSLRDVSCLVGQHLADDRSDSAELR